MEVEDGDSDGNRTKVKVPRFLFGTVAMFPEPILQVIALVTLIAFPLVFMLCMRLRS